MAAKPASHVRERSAQIAASLASKRPVTVWDEAAGQATEVTEGEARRGMLRYAGSLGAGTPACWVVSEAAYSPDLDLTAAFNFYVMEG